MNLKKITLFLFAYLFLVGAFYFLSIQQSNHSLSFDWGIKSAEAQSGGSGGSSGGPGPR